MIARVQALNYRSLRYVDQTLVPFHVLIGPNASGKSTFLDVVAFLGRLVSDGVDAAIGERTESFRDLVWKREGQRFEMAIEAMLPADVRSRLKSAPAEVARYEVAVGVVPEAKPEWDDGFADVGVLHERVFLKPAPGQPTGPRGDLPAAARPPDTITRKGRPGWRAVVSKSHGGNDAFVPESKPDLRKRGHEFRFGPWKSALGNVPPDPSLFPASNWLKALLVRGVRPIVLNGAALRRPSPPNQRPGFRADGSNLPWVIEDLRRTDPERFGSWIAHLRTALPDLTAVTTTLRADDRHLYLSLEYAGGLRVPSWMASDGTLRLLALTLPAYLPLFEGVCLIEEPENGIHPQAIETVYQSLSSVYDAQILLASHSPVLLGLASPKELLCFARTADGATDIVSGDRHPMLSEWKREANLGQLFAAGVLG